MALWSTTDVAGSKPKALTAAEKTVTFGVSAAEATANRNKGLRTPGWNTHTTYTDCNGNVRYKTDCLVALNLTGADASDDAAVKDNLITITVHPASITRTSPATATFTITASVDNADTLVYQWQKQVKGAGAWSNVGTNSSSFTTGATSIVGDSGDKYRCVLSGVSTNAVPKTSKAATLTVV